MGHCTLFRLKCHFLLLESVPPTRPLYFIFRTESFVNSSTSDDDGFCFLEGKLNVKPEIGQLVIVRRRAFVVTDIKAQSVPADEISSVNGRSVGHLVSLSSVEDDSLGEQADVIWELEPGAVVHERSSLPEPTGFDPPRVLDAFLDAVRWVQFLRRTIRRFSLHFAVASKSTSISWNP